jgi:hypothetical protein
MIKSHKIIENNKIMSKRKKKKQLQTQFINTELRKLHKKKILLIHVVYHGQR